MTSVEATCPSCGGVWVLPDEIVVRVCVDLQSSAYTFRCPEGGQRAVKPATDRIVDLLTSVGASLAMWSLPDDLREPRSGGPPISHDQLLALRVLLQDRRRVECLGQLVAGTAHGL